MLELKLITKDNLEYAVRVQNEIFPEYNGKNNYLDSIKNGKQSQFFFIMEKMQKNFFKIQMDSYI